MPHVILHLGSNIGLRNQYLQRARQLLEAQVGKLVASSAIYRTSAWGIENQRDFLNQAFCFKTQLPPAQVLEIALNTETKLGRKRQERWGERIIDIDIIFYEDLTLDTPKLVIPHPWLQERRFVLVPLNDIAPNWVHPILGKTVSDLLMICPDEGEVERVSGGFGK